MHHRNYSFHHNHIYISFAVLFLMQQKEVLIIVGVLIVGFLLLKEKSLSTAPMTNQVIFESELSYPESCECAVGTISPHQTKKGRCMVCKPVSCMLHENDYFTTSWPKGTRFGMFRTMECADAARYTYNYFL